MGELFYRPFGGEIEVRSIAQGGDGRTVFGAAVPFDHPVQIDRNLIEEWDRGAFNHQMRAMHRVPLFDLHDVHGGVRVGKLTMARADPKHLFVEGHVNDSPEGDDYLDRIRDGKRPHFSIAFDNPLNRRRGNITRRVKADLMHVAGVPEGAFGGAAALAGVRALTMEGAGQGIVPPSDADTEHHHVMSLMDVLAGCTPEECAELAKLADQMVEEGSHLS
jgi:HK97 family phage prohead protease